MQLVIDASTLVAEALRAAGRVLLTQPALALLATDDVWAETQHELRRRVVLRAARNDQPSEAALAALAAVLDELAASLTILPESEYAPYLAEAAWRIPADPRDVSTVALALASDCGIWTGDRDFFGCGLPVWSSEVLRRWLVETAEPA